MTICIIWPVSSNVMCFYKPASFLLNWLKWFMHIPINCTMTVCKVPVWSLNHIQCLITLSSKHDASCCDTEKVYFTTFSFIKINIGVVYIYTYTFCTCCKWCAYIRLYSEIKQSWEWLTQVAWGWVPWGTPWFIFDFSCFDCDAFPVRTMLCCD